MPVSVGAYEMVVSVPSFLGLYQDGDGVDVDPKYALEAVNVDTTGGVLHPAARCPHLLPALPGAIGTLARLYRRWGAPGAQDVLVAASGGALYWMLPGGAEWTSIAPPEGVEAYQSDTWSWVTYEINPEGSEAPVDVLLLSNAIDGMIMVRGDDLSASIVPTPKKFGVISRYAERIWGGAILDDPDMLVYSAPFDPFNWEQNSEFPEDGAGDVSQPSWDGDSFTALVAFGSQLIAMKRNRVWRILGTDPGQYVFKEQYGGGALFWDTVVPVGERILMLGRGGLWQYDGLTVQPYYQQFAKTVFERMNQNALSGACACMYKDRYYCALPLDGSPHNNAVLVLNMTEKTWLLRDGITVKDFLPTDDALYFTSATDPGRVYRWGEDARANGAAPCRWVSPWLTGGRKDARCGGWTWYFSVRADSPVELVLTVRTEKKAKAKRYKADATAPGDVPKQKRLHIGGSGRRFRFEIESAGGAAFELDGGLQINVERDED